LLSPNHALHVWILLAGVVVGQDNLSRPRLLALQLHSNVARGVVGQHVLVDSCHRRKAQLVHAKEMPQHQTPAVNQSAQRRLELRRDDLALLDVLAQQLVRPD